MTRAFQVDALQRDAFQTIISSSVGAGAVAIAGSLVRRFFRSVGGASVAITGSLSLITHLIRRLSSFTGRDLQDSAGRDLKDSAGRDLKDFTGRNLHNFTGRDLE